jgi:hypothetical protein
VQTLALLLVAVLLPTSLAYGVVAARCIYARHQAHRSPVSASRPVERIRADLRRLHDLLESTESAPDLPAKNLRCRATRAAYLDALTAACRQLEVRAPEGAPVSRAEIYRVEADLRRVGVDVRPVG